MVNSAGCLLRSAVHSVRCAAPSMGNNWFEIERVSPNGERVVRKSKKPQAGGPTSVEDMDAQFTRRSVLLGLVIASAYTSPKIAGLVSAPPKPKALAKVDSSYDAGDAVTRPGLENELVDLLEAPGALSPLQNEEARQLVLALEERGGTQLAAASMTGRWVLPWVGGWERVWTDNPEDSSYLGGPTRTSASLAIEGAEGTPTLRSGGVTFTQTGVRHFVYGPGEGGVTCEYTYEALGNQTNKKLLLWRLGSVTNQGGNFFRFDFDKSIQGYPAQLAKIKGYKEPKDIVSAAELVTGSDTPKGLMEGPQFAVLHTTYLSERLWIVRDGEGGDRLGVWERTEVKSVKDRRGVQVEGQVKENPDEEVRYGKLLFGDTDTEYKGWDEKQLKDAAQKDKLFGV